MMDIEEKMILNKLIRSYNGDNYWLVEFKKKLKSKYTDKIMYKNKYVKVLSDKQYDIVRDIISDNEKSI